MLERAHSMEETDEPYRVENAGGCLGVYLSSIDLGRVVGVNVITRYRGRLGPLSGGPLITVLLYSVITDRQETPCHRR